MAWDIHRLMSADVIQSQGPQSQGREWLCRWTLSDRELVTSVIVEIHSRYLRADKVVGVTGWQCYTLLDTHLEVVTH